MLLTFILLLGRLEIYFIGQADDGFLRDLNQATIKKIKTQLGSPKVDDIYGESNARESSNTN